MSLLQENGELKIDLNLPTRQLQQKRLGSFVSLARSAVGNLLRWPRKRRRLKMVKHVEVLCVFVVCDTYRCLNQEMVLCGISKSPDVV